MEKPALPCPAWGVGLQNSHPSGASGHDGSGRQPTGGRHPAGGAGQPDGGLKTHVIFSESAGREGKLANVISLGPSRLVVVERSFVMPRLWVIRVTCILQEPCAARRALDTHGVQQAGIVFREPRGVVAQRHRMLGVCSTSLAKRPGAGRPSTSTP